MRNALFSDGWKEGFIKPLLCSLALRCDPIGSDDTDSGGVVGVSVCMADKTDAEAASEIPAETLIWILGESALPKLSPIALTEPPSAYEPQLTCLTDSSLNSLFLQPKPISDSDTLIRRKQMLRDGECSQGQSRSRQSNLNLVFTALWFDSQLALRPIDILYGCSPAAPPSCAAVLAGSRWRGWKPVIVHELFNMLVTDCLLAPALCGV